MALTARTLRTVSTQRFLQSAFSSCPSFAAGTTAAAACWQGTRSNHTWSGAAVRPHAPKLQQRGVTGEQRTGWSDTDDVDLDSVAYGFMASQSLFSALELNIFDHIASHGDSGATIEQLQKDSGIEAPRLQTLITCLVAIRCLRRSPDAVYTLSPNTAKHMVSSAKHFYGDYLRFQLGRQFYHRMGALPDVMQSGKAPSYASWFSDPDVAKTYTQAQHNGSVATAKYLVKKLDLTGATDMLDVGGGSGAFSYVFAEATPGLKSTVLELQQVCRTGEIIKAQQSEDVQNRVQFEELDATRPTWPVEDSSYDVVLMSYISGSVPETILSGLYANAYKALRPKGRLIVHDFMVDDSLDGPPLAALWAVQHITVNADGLGLSAKEIINRMGGVGFDTSKCESRDVIHNMTKLVVAHKD